LTGCLPSAQDGRSPVPQWRGLCVFKCDDTARTQRCAMWKQQTGATALHTMRGCPRNEQPLFKPSPRVRGSACERVGTPQRSRRLDPQRSPTTLPPCRAGTEPASTVP
jgi:hypothetical protein